MFGNNFQPTEAEIDAVVKTFQVGVSTTDPLPLPHTLISAGCDILEKVSSDHMTLVKVIMGDFDLQIAAWFYYLRHNKLPQTYQDLYSLSAQVIELKQKLRRELMSGSGVMGRSSQETANAASRMVHQRMQARNQPHTAGTVDEIAERTGLSKKQVRRMKRDGELDTYLKQQGLAPQ